MRITVGDGDYDVVTVPVPTTTADVQAIQGAGFIVAIAMAETGGLTAAKVDVYDGDGTNGSLILPVRLAAGASSAEGFGLPGVPAEVGVFLHVVSGSIKGSVTFAKRATVGPLP